MASCRALTHYWILPGRLALGSGRDESGRNALVIVKTLLLVPGLTPAHRREFVRLAHWKVTTGSSNQIEGTVRKATARGGTGRLSAQDLPLQPCGQFDGQPDGGGACQVEGDEKSGKQEESTNRYSHRPDPFLPGAQKRTSRAGGYGLQPVQADSCPGPSGPQFRGISKAKSARSQPRFAQQPGPGGGHSVQITHI